MAISDDEFGNRMAAGTLGRTEDKQSRKTFDEFIDEVRDICDKSARGKGYNETGIDGKNQLYEFIEAMNGGHQHALGEIVYKTTRYARKNDPVDLIKIAAWAFLIWRSVGNDNQKNFRFEPGSIVELAKENFVCPSCHENIYRYGHPIKFSLLLKNRPKEDLYFCCEGCAKDFDAKLVRQTEEEARLKK